MFFQNDVETFERIYSSKIASKSIAFNTFITTKSFMLFNKQQFYNKTPSSPS